MGYNDLFAIFFYGAYLFWGFGISSPCQRDKEEVIYFKNGRLSDE